MGWAGNLVPGTETAQTAGVSNEETRDAGLVRGRFIKMCDLCSSDPPASCKSETTSDGVGLDSIGIGGKNLPAYVPLSSTQGPRAALP